MAKYALIAYNNPALLFNIITTPFFNQLDRWILFSNCENLEICFESNRLFQHRLAEKPIFEFTELTFFL